MKVRMKVWLEDNDQPVFGEGRRRLLEAICRYGSINRAAKELGQPYRKAWSSLTAMEGRLGFKLLERRTGGDCGGGSCLTAEGHDFLYRYGELMQELQLLAEEKSNMLFSGRYANTHSLIIEQADSYQSMEVEDDSGSSIDDQ
ncbi:MAG: LysR family transcriptional regulator [Mariprofundaceae bacterium]